MSEAQTLIQMLLLYMVPFVLSHQRLLYSLKPSEFRSLLTVQPGIIDLEPLTDGVIDVLKGFEFSIPANGFLPVYPRGFDDVIGSGHSFVFFFKDGVNKFSLEPFMDLVDSKGSIVGHDILPEERHLYDSPDYIWISDNMFFDVKKVAGLEMKCIIRSVSFNPDYMPEDLTARVCFPCTSSVEYLREQFGYGNDVAVVLIGVDGLEKERLF